MLARASWRSLDLHHSRGVLGQHHHAAHARRRHGGGVPMRLLIRDRREQSPVDARRALGLEEEVAVARQPRVDVTHERARADVVELARREVVAIENLLELAGRFELREVRRDALAKRLVALRQRPSDLVRRPERERDAQVRVEVAQQLEQMRVRNRVVDLALGDAANQLLARALGVLDPGEQRLLRAQLLEQCRVRRARDDLEPAADEVARACAAAACRADRRSAARSA